MLSTERTQSLSDFRAKASETLERINSTGQAEIITVNGQARAVLVSPREFDRLVYEVERARETELEADVAAIRRSMAEHAAGRSRPASEVFADIRKRLTEMAEGGK